MPKSNTRICDLLKSTNRKIDWDAYYLDFDKLQSKSKSVRQFYKDQNEQILKYKVVDRLISSPIPFKYLTIYETERVIGENLDLESRPLLDTPDQTYRSKSFSKSRHVKAAIAVNFTSNVALVVGKAFVAVLSTSISLWASLLESVLDFLSTVIVYYATSWSEHSDWKLKYKYPVARSRKRFEPLGITIFGVLMITSFLQIAMEAMSRIFRGFKGDNHIVILSSASIAIMIMTIVVKLACWVYCRSIRNSSSVEALQADARNDVVFNIITLLFPLAGTTLGLWYLDPCGALLISIYICYEWTSICVTHIKRLSGFSADLSTHKQFVYMASRFSDLIKFVKSVHVYHAGDSLICEIDIIVDENTSIRDSHDIAESLQLAIECLDEPSVERAFVHIDYSGDNPDGHH